MHRRIGLHHGDELMDRGTRFLCDVFKILLHSFELHTLHSQLLDTVGQCLIFLLQRMDIVSQFVVHLSKRPQLRQFHFLHRHDGSQYPKEYGQDIDQYRSDQEIRTHPRNHGGDHYGSNPSSVCGRNVVIRILALDHNCGCCCCMCQHPFGPQRRRRYGQMYGGRCHGSHIGCYVVWKDCSWLVLTQDMVEVGFHCLLTN